MIFQFSFMLLALGLCLMLSGVLSVFGYHVVRRGVIFVDLSLAQVAALGSSIGILLGYGEEHPLANFWLSLVFTLVGAILFSLFRRQSKAPVEALIGVTYAGAMALSLLVLEKSATGTEALKEMLIGSIITVSPHQVMWVAALCIASLFFLGFAGKRLLLITENPIEAKSKGIRIGLWDFLFYMTFGIVVTLAVKLTGVLLVFAF